MIMGGNAFHNYHPKALFPRLPPSLYQALRVQLLQHLEGCYRWVETPAEAPEKRDHGDIDFIVAKPKLLDRSDGNKTAASYDDVNDILGASWLIPSEENRTSHFAINITSDWNKTHHEEPSLCDVYCQVDVHVCADKDEWDRTVFFHGYGDLAMILGLIARNCGLHLGTKGLKVPMPHGNPPFHLSSSFEFILAFFGLSMERWKAGFKTEVDAFEWVTTSRSFHPKKLQDKENRSKRLKEKRQMYRNFTTWVQGQSFDDKVLNSTPEITVQEALDYFGKREEYDVTMNEYDKLVILNAARRRVKATFNSALITEWTGLQGFDVKKVMDKVRERTGGEEAMDGMSMEEVEDLVKRLAKEFKLGSDDELAEQLQRTVIVK